MRVESLSHRVAWDAGSARVASGTREVPADVRVEMLPGRGGFSPWAVTGLFPGPHLVRVTAKDGTLVMADWVELPVGGDAVTLNVHEPAEVGELVVTSTLAADLEVLANGAPWERLSLAASGDSFRAALPVPAGVRLRVSVVAIANGAWTRRPSPVDLTVRAGESVVVPLANDVRGSLVLVPPAGSENPSSTVHVWRVLESDGFEYVGSTTAKQESLSLTLGSYLAYVGADGGGPAFSPFEVAGDGTTTVSLRGREETRDLRIRLLDEKGEPQGNVGLWMGHLGGSTPRGFASWMAMTGEDGWAVLRGVAPADYLFSDYSTRSWCDLHVGVDDREKVVVREEAPPAPPAAVAVRFRVWDPDGRPMNESHVWWRPANSSWGRYEGGIGEDGSITASVPPGPIVVRMIPSWVVRTRHAPVELRVEVPADTGGVPFPVEIRLRR